jgi:predicted SAM-dependent methyltransferase
MKKYLIIIAGWHYLHNGFYESITDLAVSHKNVSIFIASHKGQIQIDTSLLNSIKRIPRCTINFFDNVGYDWGAYAQALDALTDKVQNYDYICFMHDDIEIIDNNFLTVFADFIENQKLKVAGNCRNAIHYPFPDKYPYILEWARLSPWQMTIKAKRWSTVRGSFFMVKPIIFKKIKKLPFRDGDHRGFGNWGVILFGGMVTDHFGIDSLKTISIDELQSPYIIEYNRGEKDYFLKIKNTLTSYIHRLLSPRKRERLTTPPKQTGVKINVGCGKMYLEGYLNIDSADKRKADVIADITTLDLKNGTVGEILMYHVIEHLNKYEAEDLFRKIYGWLNDDGRLIIECPDIAKVAALLLEHQADVEELENGPEGIRGLYGEAFPKMGIGDYHKWGYSEFTLKTKLMKTGFAQVIVEKPLSHGQKIHRDLRVVAYKSVKKNQNILTAYFNKLFQSQSNS